MAGLHWKPFLCAADNHGDQADKETLRRFFEFADDWKPAHRIHLGDLFDFRPLRRGAGAEERAERMEADVVAGQAFLEKFRPDTLLLGNHDMRLYEAAESNDGILASYAHRLLESFQGDGWAKQPQIGGLLQKLKVKRVLPYHRKRGVYRLGDIAFLHGYRSTMYPARAHAENYGNCITGHVHKFDLHVPRHIDGGMAMTAPCMSDLNMRYLDRAVAALAHDNGWIFGVVNERTGKFDAWCVRRQQDENQWIDPRAKWI